jgi:hypothetical protein
MKKFVFAFVLALACLCLVSAPTLKAQDSDTISIRDATEFNAYQMAITQTDPKAKATSLESFLTAYTQSVAKKDVLDRLIDAYQQLGDADHALSAATRLLQVDPNYMKAIVMSVMIKRSQCLKTFDPQTCDDAGALGRKGLATPKSAGASDADWKKLTAGTYPIFHSAIALGDIWSKKDIKAGIEEYRQELMLFPPEATTSGLGLGDTLQIAEAYVKLTPPDAVNAVWFYARALNYVPDNYKAATEKKLDYWYKKYHGAMDGLDAIKAQAAATLFPPGGTPAIKPAATPPEIAHGVVATTPNLASLNLGDKEYILANGVKEDAEKLWAVMKDQSTPVPGTVIEATTSGLKVAVTVAAKTADFAVALKTPVACGDVPGAGATIKQVKDFILANGAAEGTDKIEALSPDYKKPVTKMTVEGTVSVIKIAVTDDAKSAKTADFIVNLKAPVACKEVLSVGSDYGLQSKGQAELDGTYDTYTQVPATATTAQSAQIVLRDGIVQAEKKKPVPAHKPSPAHHTAAR